MWEKLKAGVEAALGGLPDEQRDAARAAIAAGAPARAPAAGRRAGAARRSRRRVAHADAALFAGLRERLGLDQLADRRRRLRADCAVDVLEFFHAIGVDAAPGLRALGVRLRGRCRPPAARRDRHRRPARSTAPSSGSPRDGEILLRGPATMAGYRHQPVATHAAIDADGWLHTGDIGTLGPDGELTIVDRKKEIIITAGGKNISPARVESELKAASPLIAHACASATAARTSRRCSCSSPRPRRPRRPRSASAAVADGQPAPRPRRADQALHAARARLAAGRRRS